jgi:hypothetical protein
MTRLASRLLIAGVGLIGLGIAKCSSATYRTADDMNRALVSIVVAGVLSTGLGAYLVLRSRGRGRSP